LWPQNALGTPVRIRSTPTTAKPGSSFVSRTIGVGVGVGVEVEVGVAVVVGVTVTLKTRGMTVVIEMFWSPDWVAVVSVTRLVVREREGEDVGVGVGEDEETFWEEDWAETERSSDNAASTQNERERIIIRFAVVVDQG
jgi:hypothetical protein